LVDNIKWVFGVAGEEGVLSGRVYGDGSGLYNDSPIQRCGWGVTAIRQSAAGIWTIVAGCYGALPGPIQSVPAAETWAFLIALRFAVPPLTFCTDCMFVVQQFRAGPADSIAASRSHADIWRLIWARIHDLGVESITVEWVKAHTTKKSVELGRTSSRDKLGNDMADELAKKGARLHVIDRQIANKYDRCRKLQAIVAKYIGIIRYNISLHPIVDAAPVRGARTRPFVGAGLNTSRNAKTSDDERPVKRQTTTRWKSSRGPSLLTLRRRSDADAVCTALAGGPL